MERFLAIDIGASSGPHIVAGGKTGKSAGGGLPFPNGVTEDRGHLVWDVEALEHHVRTASRGRKRPIPTW